MFDPDHNDFFKLLKQPITTSYIVAGVLIGPVFGLITNSEFVLSLSEIGIAFLLFIVGLELNFKRLKDIGWVASLGGTIWAEDRVEGDHTQGAKFVVMLQSWNEQKILECGRSHCISFYKSNHCLFCDPTYEILLGVMDELGVPLSVLEVINVDDPNSKIKENELPMLPLTRICNVELTGFADVDAVRSAIMNLLMQPTYPY